MLYILYVDYGFGDIAITFVDRMKFEEVSDTSFIMKIEFSCCKDGVMPP
jgi:hypothetical protein